MEYFNSCGTYALSINVSYFSSATKVTSISVQFTYCATDTIHLYASVV